MNKSGKNIILPLQALRGWAFLSIYLSHSAPDICSNGGALGVSIFIILSGFVMYYTYHDKRISASLIDCFLFSIKKIKKLYLLHVLMTFAAIPLIIVKFINESHFSSTFLGDLTGKIGEMLGCIVINLLLLQDWFPTEKIYFSMNGVSWYLSLCLFFYMVFPFILKQVKIINSVKKIIISSIMIYLIQCLIGIAISGCKDNFVKYITYILPVFRTGEFCIGVCLGYIFIHQKKLNYLLFSIIIVANFFMVYYCLITYNNNMYGLRYNMIYTPTVSLIVYSFAVNKVIFPRFLTNKFLIYLGNVSAYTFLIHQIIIRYFYGFFQIVGINIEHNTLSLYCSVICLIATLVCAQLWHRTVALQV